MEPDNYPVDQVLDTEKLESIHYKDPSWLKKLIESNDRKCREQVISIVRKIIEKKCNGSFALLLLIGYKIDLVSEKGQTALHYAFYVGATLIVQTILNWEPFKNDSCDYTDSNGLTHLHIACTIYNADVLKMIKRYLKDGSDINACCHLDPENEVNQYTPLHFAVKHHKFDIVKLLLDCGANINATDAKGRTPLHLASQLELWGKDVLETIELLITSFYADIEARDKRGDTPLLSIFDDYYNIELNFDIKEAKLKFDLLLKNGANITARNNKGDSVLHLVIKTLKLLHCNFYMPYMSFNDTGHAELVEQILENNSELLEVKNSEGKTPLQLAVSMASADVVKVLLGHNADISIIKIDCGNEKVFCYPEMVPDFDIVHNILTIVRLILDRGFEFSLEDQLIILKFLVHEVNSCECQCDDYDDNFLGKIFTALEYGSTTHIKQIFNKLIENNTINTTVLNYLWKYLNMMKEANFYMDKEIEEIVIEITLSCQSNNFVLNEMAKKELEYLKSDIKLKNGMMLYDLMSKHPHTVSLFLKDNNFDHTIINGFYLYKSIIEGFVTKAIMRNFIVKSAYAFLELSPLSPLPDLCNEIILSFLSNVDIFNLCSTAFVLE